MRDVFPNAPFLGYFEWFYHVYGSDVDFDRDEEITVDLQAKIRVKNSHLLIDLDSVDHGITPTKWQHNQFPEEYRGKISVIHDGINTDYIVPNPDNKLVLPEIDLDLSHAG